MVSELVTNAQRASGPDVGLSDPSATERDDRDGRNASEGNGPGAAGRITLTLRPLRGRIVIEVTDHYPEPPVPAEPNLDCETGRGLILVQALSEHWGYRLQASGRKTVYAVISTRPGTKPETA